MKQNIIQVGLIGLGTIGGGVAKILIKKRDSIKRNTGLDFRLKIYLRFEHTQGLGDIVKGIRLTRKASDILNDPVIDQVVELIGGLEPAGRFIREALLGGKDAVTANKALLAEQGGALYRTSMNTGRHIGMEAAVCGGVPVIQGLKQGLVANRIISIQGILNGTCNYVLTEMSRTQKSYAEALRDAQVRGYAEKDPALDVNGTDTAHKLAILARLAFKREIDFRKIYCEGIQQIAAEDIQYARELGYVIKLIAAARMNSAGRLELRVHPALLDQQHPLANVHGVHNGVLFHGDETGAVSFYGKGAGERPTASAVVSDMIHIALLSRAGLGSGEKIFPKARLEPVDRIQWRYYLRFRVPDRPGVMGALTGALGRCGVSLASVHQKETSGSPVSVVILTHRTEESKIRRALRLLAGAKHVRSAPVMIRLGDAEGAR